MTIILVVPLIDLRLNSCLMVICILQPEVNDLCYSAANINLILRCDVGMKIKGLRPNLFHSANKRLYKGGHG